MNDPIFMQELEQFKQQIEQEAKMFVQEVVEAMLDQITDTNPLDTGKCTASWEASVGSPVYQEATDVTSAVRINRGQAKARSMGTLQLGLINYGLGDIIYLSNGTSYVSRLEMEPGYVKTKDGHANFVEKTSGAFAHLTDSKINIP